MSKKRLVLEKNMFFRKRSTACKLIGISLLINAIFLFVLLYAYKFVFFINDDQLMNFIAGGAFAGENSNLVFLNYFVSKIIRLMYLILPKVNCYILFMYSCMYFSLSAITAVLLARINTHKSIAVTIGLAAFLIIYGGHIYKFMAFTQVAEILAIAGFSIFVYYGEKLLDNAEEKSKTLMFTKKSAIVVSIAFAFLLLSIGVRKDAFLSIALIFGLHTIYYIVKIGISQFKDIKTHNFKWQNINKHIMHCATILLAFLVCISSSAFSDFWINRDPDWKEYNEFNKTRSEITDLGRANVSEKDAKDFALLYNGYCGFNSFMADNEVFSQDKMTSWLAKKAPVKKENFIQSFKYLTELFKSPNYKYRTMLMVSLLLLLLLLSKKRHTGILLIAILIFEYMALGVIGRFKEYVDIGIWMGVTILGLILFEPSNKINKLIHREQMFILRTREKQTQLSLIMSMIMVTYMFVLPVLVKENIAKEKKAFEAANLQASVTPKLDTLVEIAQNKQNLYIAETEILVIGTWDYKYYTIDLNNYIVKNSFDNVIFTGGWGKNAKFEQETMRKYGVKNPIKALMEKDNVYLLSSGGRENIQYLVDFLDRHYGYKGEPQIVETKGTINVYKFI